MRSQPWRNYDWALLVVTLIIASVGVLMVYSAYEATLPREDKPLWENSAFRQAAYVGIGLVFSIVLTALDYHWIGSLYRVAYLGGLAMLAVTAVIGGQAFGAQSWLNTSAFSVQVSEICKVILIIVAARLLSADYADLSTPLPLALSLALLLPMVLFIYLQPDFGTALIVVAIWGGMVLLSGVHWQHLVLLGVGAGVAAPVVWFRLKPYMQARILGFFMPDADPTGSSYNINQALISIGSGGWWGKGLLHGTQTQLHFLRVRHTDFIFSALAEEFGFVGSTLLVLLFVVLLLRLLRIATRAADHEGRLIATGAALMIFVQAAINLGMNANILPVTGLPLPLVSYGGSSMLATMMAIGLAQSVAVRSRSAEQSLIPF